MQGQERRGSSGGGQLLSVCLKQRVVDANILKIRGKLRLAYQSIMGATLNRREGSGLVFSGVEA
jgi:hypothetical protein